MGIFDDSSYFNPLQSPFATAQYRPTPSGAFPNAPAPGPLSIPPAQPPIFLSPPDPADAPGQPAGPWGSLVNGINNHALTLMALGAGIAQGGVGRGLAAAATAAEGERNRQAQQLNFLQTYKALTDGGVSPQEAQAAIGNPSLMRALAAKYLGPRSSGVASGGLAVPVGVTNFNPGSRAALTGNYPAPTPQSDGSNGLETLNNDPAMRASVLAPPAGLPNGAAYSPSRDQWRGSRRQHLRSAGQAGAVMPIDSQFPFAPADPSRQTRALPRIVVHPKQPNAPPDDSTGADGIDDWFVPGQGPGAPDGLDDWFVPTAARPDTYPDDWLVPAPAAPPSIGQASAGPQAGGTDPGRSNAPAARPDPHAAYWSLNPARRTGAMAWQPPIFLPPNPFSPENIPASKWLTPPPIFLNSPGQALSPPAAPPGLSSIPPGGLLGALANLPAAHAPRSGLLDALANLPSADPAAFPSFQRIGGASDDFDRSVTPPFFQSLGDFPLSPPSVASGDSGVGDGPTIEGNNTGQSSTLNDPSYTPPLKLPSGLALPQRHSEPTNSETSLARQDTPPSGHSNWFATPLLAPNSVRSSEQSDAGDNSVSRSAGPPTDSNELNSITRVVRDPSGRALAIIHVRPAPFEASQSQSDATPDSLRPGAKFAQINNAITGRPIIDRTTDILLSVLEESVRAMGAGAGARFGTAVHVDFANRVKKLDLPGIGQDGVEESFGVNWKDLVYYGLVDTIRTDVTLRDPKDPLQRPIAVYDLKTGYAVLTPRRVKEIKDNVDSPGLLVIELQYRTRDVIDRTGIYPRR